MLDERLTADETLPTCPICTKIVVAFVIKDYNKHVKKCFSNYILKNKKDKILKYAPRRY